MNVNFKRAGLAAAVAGVCLTSATTFASSHREAPFITEIPKVDGTDFYMFRSYEPGRGDYVTLIANYQPLQAAYGGPNYFTMDDDAIYEIHIDNDANAEEDITFQFSFNTIETDVQIPIGDEMVSVPLKNANVGDSIGPEATDTPAVQVRQEYELKMISGDRRSGTVQAVMNASGGGNGTFRKPIDNIGEKSISDYATYAGNHVYETMIPGCDAPGRVFVGQRKDAFAVNLGEIFDLVNLEVASVTGAPDQGLNTLDDANVTSFALEVPTACLTGSAETAGGQPVIGSWTTASLPQARVLNPQPESTFGDDDATGAAVTGGAFTQVSRLGMPLVNEVVIGLKDKDLFNASEPVNDGGNFLTYVTNPTLPTLLQLATGGEVTAPDVYPRNDLVATFLTGVTIPDTFSNQPAGGTPSEMLRLNTALPAANADATSHNQLGLLGGDASGFPNGRRPSDDVVDIELRAANGVLFDLVGIEGGPATRNAALVDGAVVNTEALLGGFPYLGTPIAGSPTKSNP